MEISFDQYKAGSAGAGHGRFVGWVASGRLTSAAFHPRLRRRVAEVLRRSPVSSFFSDLRRSSRFSPRPSPTVAARHASGARLAWSLLFGSLSLAAAGRVSAMSADGALVTNVVTATYNGMGYVVGQPGSTYAVSYYASAYVLVSCPVIYVQKVATPTVQVTGGTVTFQLWVVNNSLGASAFNVSLVDALPVGMGYVAPSFSGWDPSGTWYRSWGSAPGGPWTANAEPPNGQLAPAYLEWTANIVGPGKSALVTYLVTVQ